ncbi:MAG: FAD-binding protein, partial [Candidatus Binatia bacterium]
ATPVTRLITNSDGHVAGVSALKDGREIRIKARRGVVLACGGFENNSEMKLQYFELQPVYPVYLGNTGDGILMAQKIGATLWHMWHFHGSYGFKFPEFPFAIRHVWAGPRKNDRKMIWIALDRYGHRFMNEYPPAPQDTGARPLEFYDPDIQDYPRVPCTLIFDEEGRKMGPVAMVIVNDERYHYQWSEDNFAEIEKGWIQKGETLEEIAEKTKVPKEILTSTVKRWNLNCEQGSDVDFKRRPKTMMPIATPPFYAMEAWPIVSNTQGGLVHDALQRVLDPMGQSIPHLYAAGEISSIYGHLYLEAGNITEAFVGGRIAGQNVSREEPLN